MVDSWAKLSKRTMDRLAILRESVVGWKLDKGGLWAKISKRTMDRLAILRESVVGWKLDKGGLLGQAFQTDHGPFGHLAGVGGGLETR